jgi:hypothetical protein
VHWTDVVVKAPAQMSPWATRVPTSSQYWSAPGYDVHVKVIVVFGNVVPGVGLVIEAYESAQARTVEIENTASMSADWFFLRAVDISLLRVPKATSGRRDPLGSLNSQNVYGI